MFCAIGDGMFRERLQHCCKAKEKLILSLESIPAWGAGRGVGVGEKRQHLEGVGLGHASTCLL